MTRSGLRHSPDGPQTGGADHGGMPRDRSTTSGPIIVGVERSERSRDAVALGRTLARSLGRELLLVAVYLVDVRSALMSPAAHAAALADEADATLEWVARPFSGPVAQTRAVPSTSVARGLQAVAEEEDALAIVVGPSHRGALGHVVPGSVGERLLRSAPCPVAVAPSGYRAAEPGAIRSHRRRASPPSPRRTRRSRAAIGIAARTGAAIQVLSVVEPPSAVVLGYAWGYGELEQTARDDLAGSLAAHDGRGRLPSRDRRRRGRRLRRRRARPAVDRGRPARLRLAWPRRAWSRHAGQRLGGRDAQGPLPGPHRPPRGPGRLRRTPSGARGRTTSSPGRRRKPSSQGGRHDTAHRRRRRSTAP